MDTTSTRSDSIENVIKFYQGKYNTTFSNKSISDTFKEFFGYDLNAIDTWIDNQFNKKVSKNTITSVEYRKQGNLFFIKRNLQQSLQCYTKSLCSAFPLSEEYSLALGNRSAVTFEIGNYEDSLKDIDTCLESNYPKKLRAKILIRKAECLKKLNRLKDLIIYLDETFTFFKSLPLVDQDKYIEKYNKLRVVEEVLQEVEQENPAVAISAFPDFNGEENSEFAYASSKIEVRYNSISGRHVVAKQNILKGDILFLEKAFSFSPIYDVETRVMTTEKCYHCLKDIVSGIPCDSCVQCIFCDKTCKNLSWKEYHKWECEGMQTDMWYYLGIALPAFKTFCKGITSNFSAVRDIYTKSKSGYFGSKIDNYLYFDSLVYHFRKNDMGTLICSAIVVKYLSKYTTFFQTYLTEPNCPEQDLNSLKKYVGSCIAKHILQLGNNSTVIEHWINTNVGLPSQKKPIACGIFPSVSIMNHSCRPNITNYFINDTIVVKALKNMENKEEIFNCYGIDYRTMRKNERQKQCIDLYNFECKCDICIDCTKEMDMFDTFVCMTCGYTVHDDDRKFYFCENCKSKIDLNQLRELNANVGKILEGEVNEDALLCCLNYRKQFLSQKHTDLQDAYYEVYQLYARKADFHNLITYFELWMENEKIRIGENAQKFVHILYEIGSLIVKHIKTNIRYENKKYLLEKANIMLNEAKTISSLYYPDYFIYKIKWE